MWYGIIWYHDLWVKMFVNDRSLNCAFKKLHSCTTCPFPPWETFYCLGKGRWVCSFLNCVWPVFLKPCPSSVHFVYSHLVVYIFLSSPISPANCSVFILLLVLLHYIIFKLHPCSLPHCAWVTTPSLVVKFVRI
jgi:hypothetical protein